MAIIKLTNDSAGHAEYAAIAGNKHLLITPGDSGYIVVFTGSDIPLSGSREVSTEDFRDRFTPAETAAMLAAAQTDVIMATAQWLLATDADRQINLDDLRVTQTVAYMVGKGILTPDRAAEVLV